MITLNGKTQNVTQWCEELGVNRKYAYKKLKEGMDAEEVFHGRALKQVQKILDEREG